ncbi:glycosyltransferase family 2 protein [Novosphingobium sp. KCTC 2891]|uniref:glycosyltransferase family 2 protein n=1 Tax=Novosphingobium sp. KCTC 2891 TaxID=2989730 RepID=UPI002222E569|nr:glycosyltransferase family A protein [Novosphingobium sp. KCTC 2891]MCW1382710.1 glycosyltransferase family 2 protein [Novosphingobium sp. KCTC 2891]
MAPRFSVIMPVLDQERYLAEAIASVQAQDLPDWELLIVDDGSRDASLAIAEGFARADARVRVLRHADGGRRGAAAARNLALNAVTGEFVTFLDGDDLFLSDRLSAHAALLDANPGLRCVYGATRWLDDATGRTWEEELGPVTGRIHQPPQIVRRIVVNHEGAVPCICAATLGRAEVLAVGGFDEAFGLFEDQTLWVKVFARHLVFVTSHCGAVYRQHRQSTSSRVDRGELAGFRRPDEASHQFLAWMRQHLAAEGLSDLALDRDLGWWLRRFDGRVAVRWAARGWVRLSLVARRWRRRLARRL